MPSILSPSSRGTVLERLGTTVVVLSIGVTLLLLGCEDKPFDTTGPDTHRRSGRDHRVSAPADLQLGVPVTGLS
jgi:hypothetical protein